MSRETIQTVFENEHWLVVDKPAGWLTVPGRSWGPEGTQTPLCLGRELESQLKIRLWPVHRLDREVSGLVLFAKTAEAHRSACGWFESRDVSKTYEAVTPDLGRPTESGSTVTWRMNLLRGKKRAYESPEGKEAVTEAISRAVFMRNGRSFLLWQLNPLTGRSHQLRVTLARFYAPIVGDILYGADEALAHSLLTANDGILLRAVSLDFSAVQSDKRNGLPEHIHVKGLLP